MWQVWPKPAQAGHTLISPYHYNCAWEEVFGSAHHYRREMGWDMVLGSVMARIEDAVKVCSLDAC